MEHARKIYGIKIQKKILNRLDYEFKIIKNYNLENDLLALSLVINKWRDLKYFINGTGILKESLIAYLLGMIDVNPMHLNKLFELDFTKKQFEIIVSKEIQEEFDNNLKEKKVNIQIKYKSWFKVELLNALENEFGISSMDISLDDKEILKKTIKKVTLGQTLTTAELLDDLYGLESHFGMNNEELITFYDYINYDKDCNDEYSTELVIDYYITYFRVHFPSEFYQIYVDYLIDYLALDDQKQVYKMWFLTSQIIDIYNKGYKLL